MRQKSIFGIIMIVGLFSVPIAFAEPKVELVMEKSTYSYGDKLFYTINVSEIVTDVAIIYISDESGKKSSPIPVSISELVTPVPSLYPFEREVFPVGKYLIEVEYAGITDSIEFNLIDTGKIVIPSWIKQLAYYWITDQVSDVSFADSIEFLIEKDIITIPTTELTKSSDNVQIPNWVKVNAQWWLEEQISDDEFAKAIQYLIKVGIIVIGDEVI